MSEPNERTDPEATTARLRDALKTATIDALIESVRPDLKPDAENLLRTELEKDIQVQDDGTLLTRAHDAIDLFLEGDPKERLHSALRRHPYIKLDFQEDADSHAEPSEKAAEKPKVAVQDEPQKARQSWHERYHKAAPKAEVSEEDAGRLAKLADVARRTPQLHPLYLLTRSRLSWGVRVDWERLRSKISNF